MNQTLAFAADADRLRLLYRLPLSGQERRVLVIGTADDRAAAFGPSAAKIDICSLSKASECLLSSQDHYDAVALPGSWAAFGEGASGMPQPLETISIAFGLLRPGGVLIAHLEHFSSLHVWRRIAIRPGLWIRVLRLGPLVSARGCELALGRAGFQSAEAYFVEPRISAPVALIPCRRRAERRHFISAVRKNRSSYSIAGYMLRMVLAYVGLGGALQPHVFLMARRPC